MFLRKQLKLISTRLNTFKLIWIPRRGKPSEDAKKRFLAVLETFNPKPTMTMDTGNGIQCLWRKDERIVLHGKRVQVPDPEHPGKTKLTFEPEDQAKVDDAEARTGALIERLGGDITTRNIDRIFRLPGTTNLPNKKKLADKRVPCPTALLWFNGASYDLKAFPLPEPEQMGPGTPDDGGHHAEANDNEEKLERIIRDGPDAGEFTSRSHAVWYVINELLRRNCPERAILSTILSKSNNISAHVYDQADPADYATKQIAKAREKFTKTKDAKGKTTVVVFPDTQYYGAKPTPIPAALVKGIFPQIGVATIGGPSGGGKSSHAIHLATRLIPDCNQLFYIDKYRIKRHGGILYLVLEDKASYPLRVTTAFEEMLPKQMEFGDRFRLPFAWNTYTPSLFNNGRPAETRRARSPCDEGGFWC
jgi:hypothetical protein